MFSLFGRKVRAKPQLDPSRSADVNDLLRRADALRENSDSSGALQLYQKVLEGDPKCLHAMYWLAALYEEAGDLQKAKEYCERGLAIDPNQIGLLLRIGNVASRSPRRSWSRRRTRAGVASGRGMPPRGPSGRRRGPPGPRPPPSSGPESDERGGRSGPLRNAGTSSTPNRSRS